MDKTLRACNVAPRDGCKNSLITEIDMKHQRWMPCAVMAATMTLWAMTASAQGAPGQPPAPPANNPTTLPGVPGAQQPAPGAAAPGNFYQQAPSNQAGSIYQPVNGGAPQNAQGPSGLTMPVMNPPQQQMQQPQGGNMAAMPQSAPQNLPPLPNGSVPQRADFDNVIANYLSVTPDQIRQLRRSVDARAQAAAETPGPEPRPTTGSVAVSLSPGAGTPVIRGFLNHTSSFVVVDATGQPWPVENFRVGNGNAFQVNRLDNASNGSSFTADAQTPYARTNLILKLAGVSTPVAVDLIAGQKEFDERMELRVQGRGPNAQVSNTSMTPATDSRLLPMLDGVAPAGGKSLHVAGGDSNTRAWMQANGRMVVRTSMKIVSPASASFVSSSDGTNVYEFMPTSALVGIDKASGRLFNMTVEGW